MAWKKIKKLNSSVYYSCSSESCDWGEWHLNDNTDSFDAFHMCPWCSGELDKNSTSAVSRHEKEDLKEAA